MKIAIKSLVFLFFGVVAFVTCYSIALAEIWAINTVFSTSIGNGWKEVLAFMLIHFVVAQVVNGNRTRK